MSEAESSLVKYAQQLTKDSKFALLYFGTKSSLAAKRVQIDKEWPGVIVCDCADGSSFMIDTSALVVVKEGDDFD